MFKFTLSLVLNKNMTHVLMCDHQKFHKLNYIGGKIENNESVENASYRELFEETGISRDNIELHVFRHEIVELYNSAKKAYQVYPDFDMYISIGVLKNDIILKEEKNPLYWIDIHDTEKFLHANGDGNCYTFLVEGLAVLKESGYKGVPSI